jgi:hypothetical protein
MFVAPGPIELVQAIMRRRRVALTKATAARAITCSLCERRGRQPLACAVQRLAETGDVAMPENRENTGKQGHFAAVDFARLRREIANERLGHRQTDRGHVRPRCSILL